MTYTVKGGDTLSQIAERALGDWARWYEIYIRNSKTIANDPRNIACRKQFGGGPEMWIFPGQVLMV